MDIYENKKTKKKYKIIKTERINGVDVIFYKKDTFPERYNDRIYSRDLYMFMKKMNQVLDNDYSEIIDVDYSEPKNEPLEMISLIDELSNRNRMLELKLEINNKEIADIFEDNIEKDFTHSDFKDCMMKSYEDIQILCRNERRINEIKNHFNLIHPTISLAPNGFKALDLEMRMHLKRQKNNGSIEKYDVKTDNNEKFIALFVTFKDEVKPVYFVVTENTIKFSNEATVQILNMKELEDD